LRDRPEADDAIESSPKNESKENIHG